MNRWIDARRNHQYFVSKNAEWLEQEISLHINVISKVNATDYKMPGISHIRGRRKLAFEVSSERGKRRKKKKKLRKNVGFPELTYVTQMSRRSTGKMDTAKLVSETLETIQR